MNSVQRCTEKSALTLGFTLLLVCCIFACSNAQTAALKTFPISFWCGPPDSFITTEQFRLIKNAGFTIVAPPCEGANTVERNKKILDTAKAVGLKVLLADARMPLSVENMPNAKENLKSIVKDYSRHPALFGYFVTDEPGAGRFSGLAEVVKTLRQLDSAHTAYINLFPNYASNNRQIPQSQLQTDSYLDYLQKYVRTVTPDVLSYDHYHFLQEGDRPGFFGNLEDAQRVAKTANIPFWNIVLSVQHGPYRALSENELRFEAMQTLVYGGKGLVYFTYWLPQDDSTFQWKHAIMNRDGTPRPLYEPVKKVNGEVQALAKWLYTSNIIRTWHTGNIPTDGRPQPSDLPVRSAGEGDLTMGMFRDPKGNVLLMVTNRDYRNNVKSKIRLSIGSHTIESLNLTNGKWSKVTGAKDGEEATLVDVDLSPAGTMLFRW